MTQAGLSAGEVTSTSIGYVLGPRLNAAGRLDSAMLSYELLQTSDVFRATELAIQQAVETLMKNRTSLVVAHRLSTVRNADRIIVLNRGRIIETGSHVKLMKRKGFYYKLQQLQNGLSLE